jgi:biopolymer transport protein ExbD/biopolymer transport protein TolR
MGMSGPSGSKQPSPEINITPLVDIVLVLLIIFMVVTPAMAEGEQITLPKLVTVDEKPKDMNPIELTMALNGRILLEKVEVKQSELKKRLKELHEADREKHLRLNADRALPYKKVRDTMAILQDVGFNGVSIKVEENTAGKAATAAKR